MPAFTCRALLALGFFLSFGAGASQAGLGHLSVPGLPTDPEPIVVALYYPTEAAERSIAMGPFSAHVAMGGAPAPQVKGLILLSHGNAGSELAHGSLAEALARDGYLVAALRHPGDNWQDSSLLSKGAARYFADRPRQASRVIDALLSDPGWKDRIASDAKGPRIGAVGHSAGGYTVLALAGAQPELPRVRAHCSQEGAEDPIFCGMASRSPVADSALPPLVDPRVRAVVAMAPVGVVFAASSLAAMKLPTRVYAGEQDTFLVPRFHARWIAKNAPGVDLRMVPNASHWAFIDTPSSPIGTVDGDIATDPPGFDRAAFLKRIDGEIPAFFDQALR